MNEYGSADEPRRWGNEAKIAYEKGDVAKLDRLVKEARESRDDIAILICRAWRGDLGQVLNETF